MSSPLLARVLIRVFYVDYWFYFGTESNTAINTLHAVLVENARVFHHRVQSFRRSFAMSKTSELIS